MSKVKINSNFHHLEGNNLFQRKDAKFQAYRKKWKQWPEKLKVGKYPLFIDLEVTSSCNLKCPFCATTFRGDKIKKGFIDFALVKKIIDEGAKNGLCGVKFNIRGEPLLHPKIAEFVKYAKDKGLVDVYFNTNAMLLNEINAKKLIDAGLDRLSISFEGYTKDVYEKNRRGADFKKVIKNIALIQGLKKKLNVSHPKIRIQTVLLPDLVPYLKNYKAFWKDKVDEIAYLDYKEMKTKKTGIVNSWICPQIWQRMAVWWDGTILPCNHDDDALLSLGNAKKVSLKDAWNSMKMKSIRKMHKEAKAHLINACDGCYLRDSEINKFKKGQ